MGRSADVYASTLAGGVWVASWWRQWVCVLAFRTFRDLVPIAPMGSLLTCPLLESRVLAMVASWWRQNVSACLLNFPRHFPHCPLGKSLTPLTCSCYRLSACTGSTRGSALELLPLPPWSSGSRVLWLDSHLRCTIDCSMRYVLCVNLPTPPWIAVQCDSMHLRSTPTSLCALLSVICFWQSAVCMSQSRLK